MTYTIQKSYRKPATPPIPYWTSAVITATIPSAMVARWGLSMLTAWKVFL